MRLTSSFTVLAALVSAVSALTLPFTRHHANSTLATRQDAPKMVFAHFMVGIVASYTTADWENDIKQAMGIGIDAFALNCGTDSYTVTQLQNAYDAANNVGGGNFKLFISFDFTSFDSTNVQPVADIIKQFSGNSAQLMIDGKMFVSSFYGEGFGFRAAEASSGVPLFACPAWGPTALQTADADCGMAWAAWPSQDNQPIAANMTTANDLWWITNLAGKPYMAGVSPWFFTHYGADTWNKNWLFLSDTLWTDRWDEMLSLSPQFIEIITWNDFGESHYIGPLRDDNQDVYAGGATGAAKWVPGHDHSAWATVAAPYIAAYKQGASSPIVSSEHLVYYYRPQSKSLQCSDSVPAPTGSDFVADSVFVTVLLTQPASVIITSGGNAPISIDVEAGVHTVSAPMGVGKQTFALVRDGNTLLSGDGYKDIVDSCTVYDFNVFVGEVSGSPASAPPPASQPIPPATSEPAPPVTDHTALPTSRPASTASTPASSSTSEPQPSDTPTKTTNVTFSTTHTTVWGQNVYVVGDVDALGNWDNSRAIMLGTDSSTYPSWSVSVNVTAVGSYSYKYILKDADGNVIWEDDSIRKGSVAKRAT